MSKDIQYGTRYYLLMCFSVQPLYYIFFVYPSHFTLHCINHEACDSTVSLLLWKLDSTQRLSLSSLHNDMCYNFNNRNTLMMFRSDVNRIHPPFFCVCCSWCKKSKTFVNVCKNVKKLSKNLNRDPHQKLLVPWSLAGLSTKCDSNLLFSFGDIFQTNNREINRACNLTSLAEVMNKMLNQTGNHFPHTLFPKSFLHLFVCED